MNDDSLKDGLCRTMSPDIWFPHSRDKVGHQRAKRLCYNCPVLEACRAIIIQIEVGLHRHDIHGVIAGMTPTERAGVHIKQVRKYDHSDTCSMPKCGLPYHAHDLCKPHYQAQVRARNKARRDSQ